MTAPAQPPPPPPPQPTGRPCVVCGGPVIPREHQITVKERPKFGAIWVVLTLATCLLAGVLWLMMPRQKVVVGVDRWLECTKCGSRQP